MDNDEYAYLRDGFNIKPLKKATIRQLLIRHDVPYDDSMKKDQLINLFEQNIRPRRAELREQFISVSASSANIEGATPTKSSNTAPAPASSGSQKDQDEPIAIPKRAGRSMSPRRQPARRELSPGRASPRRTSSGRRNAPAAEEKPELAEIPKLQPVRQSEPVQAEKTVPKSPRSPRRRANRKVDIPEVPAVPNVPLKSDVVTKAKRSNKRSHDDMESESEYSSNISINHSFSNDNPFQSGRAKRTKKEPTEHLQSSTIPPVVQPDHIQSFLPSELVGDGSIRYNFPLDTSSDDTPKSSHATPEAQVTTPKRPQIVQPEEPEEPQEAQDDVQNTPTRATRAGFVPKLSEMEVSPEFEQLVEPQQEVVREELPEEVDIEIDTYEVVDPSEYEIPEKPKCGFIKCCARKIGKASYFTLNSLLYLSVWIGGLILIGTAVMHLIWYRQAALDVEFCNVASQPRHVYPEWTTKDFGNEYISQFQDFNRDLMDLVWPSCINCPEKAQCYANREIVCEPGYVVKYNLLSLGNLIPTEPKCVPDWEETRKLKVAREFIVNFLRDLKATAACSQSNTEQLEACPVSPQEIKDSLYSRKDPQFPDEEFETLMDQAIDSLSSAYPEVYVVRNKHELFDCEQALTKHQTTSQLNRQFSDNAYQDTFRLSKETQMGLFDETQVYLGTRSNENIPIRCRIRIYFTNFWNRHWLTISGSLAGSVVFALLVLYYRRRQQKRQAINQRVREIINKLIVQSNLAHKDHTGKTEGFLRSFSLLQDVPVAKRDQIIKLVEQTEYVRVRQLEVKGEIMRVWDWTK